MIVIHGAGGHGRDLACIVRAARGYWPPLIDDNPARDDPAAEYDEYLIGANWPDIRAKIARTYHDGDLPAADAVIHPDSYVGPACQLAAGVVVAAHATVANGVTLGEHTHVNIGAQLVRCDLGDLCAVGPGVKICGDVRIGDRVLVGAGATICDRVTIGDDAKIGAGAVVLRRVPAGRTVVGVPGRELIR